MMIQILRVIGILELLVITLGFWAFILLFHVLSNWRKSIMGWHFMTLNGTCAFILTWSMVNLIVPIPIWVRISFALVLYGFLAWVVLRQILILIKTQVISRGTVTEVLEGTHHEHTDAA